MMSTDCVSLERQSQKAEPPTWDDELLSALRVQRQERNGRQKTQWLMKKEPFTKLPLGKLANFVGRRSMTPHEASVAIAMQNRASPDSVRWPVQLAIVGIATLQLLAGLNLWALVNFVSPASATETTAQKHPAVGSSNTDVSRRELQLFPFRISIHGVSLSGLEGRVVKILQDFNKVCLPSSDEC